MHSATSFLTQKIPRNQRLRGTFKSIYPNQQNQLFPDSGKSGHDAEHCHYCEDEAVVHVADDINYVGIVKISFG